MEIVIKSLEDLEIFARKFSECIRGYEIILLFGNLASGKTTFTKFLVKSLNPEMETEVNSPTFNVMNVYDTEKFPIYHIDLYRVKEFDITDLIGNGLVIVEWAEYMDFTDLKDVPVIFLTFNIIDENKRVIKIKSEDEKFLKCLKNFLL